jgi:HlyD family secretion protein
MEMKKRAGLLAILVIVILAIVYGFMPRAVPVETATVSRGKMRVIIEEEGKTRVVNRYVVSAPVSGYALRVEFDVGDQVNKGQAISELEPLRPSVLDPRSRAEAEAKVAAARASINTATENGESARAADELTKKELHRIKKLYNEDLVSREQMDEAETAARRASAALKSALFAVEVARHEMEAAMTALKYSAARVEGDTEERVAIQSPVNGKILKIHHESEGVVTEGQPLIEIGDPDLLEVEVDVLSEDAVRIEPGMTVYFNRWGGEEPLEGKVRTVEPFGFTKISALGVEEQRVLVISDIVSPRKEWERLGDGYRVEAAFVLWQDDDVLQVPSSSLFRYEDEWAVFIVDNDKADLRKIEIGHENGLVAEVLSGVEKGEIVIRHPDSSIEDGTTVKSRNN